MGKIFGTRDLEKDIIAIERVQRRSTKLVSNVRDLSYIERLKTLKLPSLSYRRFIGDMIEVFKLLNKLEDIDYEKFFCVK